MPHLISLDALTTDDVEILFNNAESYLSTAIANNTFSEKHKGVVASNLFFENSTRTCNSFQLAEMRHSMLSLSPSIERTALSKGETFLDTALNLEAMGTRLFVVRHGEHHAIKELADNLSPDSRIINAGSGESHHPTQALIDLFTLKQYKPEQPLTVAIIGDIKHSRVVRSLLAIFKIVGIRDIRLIAPPEFISEALITDDTKHYASIREGLKQADVVYCLRIQKERIDKRKHPTNDVFHDQYGLTEELLTYAKSDAIVMHPGPINRGIEIASNVADGPQSVILRQVENSVAVRMATIDYVFA